MDEVTLTRAQLKTFAALNEEVTVTAVNTDAQMVFAERTKYRGKPGEGKWYMPHGKPRKDAVGVEPDS